MRLGIVGMLPGNFRTFTKGTDGGDSGTGVYRIRIPFQ